MITFSIIVKLKHKGVQYRVDKYEGNSLWLSDDVTLIANSIKDMKQNIEALRESAKEIGLEINEKKSKVLQVRGTQKPEEICGLEVVDEIRYLGVKLGGRGRNIFREEKISWEKKAQTGAIQVISQVGRSYDKVSWKSNVEIHVCCWTTNWKSSSIIIKDRHKESTIHRE